MNNEKNVQNAILEEAAKQTGDSTALVAAQVTAIAEVKGAPAYATQMLEQMKADFIDANAGLDLDFVYMGSWLVFDKKGNFHEKDNEDIKYGDHIDVLIGQGEKRWSLWGLQDSPEDGQLIVSRKEREEAANDLVLWLEQNPDAASRYSIDDLELRYMAYVIPVECLKEDSEVPKVYIMSFAPTNTIVYGKYAQAVYGGAYKKLGIPARTGINRVVTRIKTEDKKGKDPRISWIGLEFEAMGMFNPADFGMVVENTQE